MKAAIQPECRMKNVECRNRCLLFFILHSSFPDMARWHHCNILKPEAAGRKLWQFDAVKDGFKLNREQAIFNGKPIPQSAVAKSWDSLWRRKLNLALLPGSQVFLRALQVP